MHSVSLFDLFSVGIGPSSSHTVGPMRACYDFIRRLGEAHKLAEVAGLQADLYGSLALTGLGHGTDKAVLMGLQGELPEQIDPDKVVPETERIKKERNLWLNGEHQIDFDPQQELIFHFQESLPRHANGLRLTAKDSKGATVLWDDYYSIGGGFIQRDAEFDQPGSEGENEPYPFDTAQELLQHCRENNMTIAELMMANERTWRGENDIIDQLKLIDRVMTECVENGCQTDGVLPGGLEVKRRAKEHYDRLIREQQQSPETMVKWDWLNVYAMAVNEENAAGGRVVTAPTNGAAGIVPSVLMYYKNFLPYATEQGVLDYLLTAGAIAILFKKGASISGAEMGCQGEVGVACSMAAGALTAVTPNVTIEQIENAAEIGLEHNLGLTCDPVKGLVQIPCIERNAMASVKAVNASRMAVAEHGEHKVFLDKAIATMRDTGRDMMAKYKETSLGGLAVNVPEC